MSKVLDTSRKSNLLLYDIRAQMLQRCSNPKNKSFHRYGGRGISVCKEWVNSADSFIEWCLLNGWARRLHIDRIDNDKGYYPENCRIVSHIVNLRNTSQCRYITFNGSTKCLREWGVFFGVTHSTISKRIERLGVSAALTTPFKKRKVKNPS